MSSTAPAIGKISKEAFPATAPPDERRRFGVALRKRVARSAHAEWRPGPDRTDPIAILLAQGKNRIQELLPIRYERMRADPFAFMRGAAAIMASDLAHTPTTGYFLQSCGDGHLANFGAYASPEGLPVFDLNDFDESLPAPFEWDLKRLAASLVVAGRVGQHSSKSTRSLARTAVQAYREHMARLASLSPVEVWNQRIDLAFALDEIEQSRLRGAMERRLAHVLESSRTHYGLVGEKNGEPHLPERPPLVYRLDDHELPAREAFASYSETLQENSSVLLQRYTLRDVAFKAVGVGSVGTFCAIGLLTGGDRSPLLLQIKEAQESVLAPFAGASAYANHGERVVVGQRMMQAASDAFLGWTRAPIKGRHFYVRRLKDSRLAEVGGRLEEALPFYAKLCGRTLARAHARAGDAALISGYVGNSAAFDEAISDFAVAYGDQTERDWKAFEAAIGSGRIVAADPTKKRP